MATADYRVTVVLDYTASWDGKPEELDEDYLHDALMSALDTADLNFDTEHPIFDEDGDETEETATIQLTCDTVREIEVVDIT